METDAEAVLIGVRAGLEQVSNGKAEKRRGHAGKAVGDEESKNEACRVWTEEAGRGWIGGV